MNKLLHFSAIFLSAFIFANSMGLASDEENSYEEPRTVLVPEQLFSDLNQRLDDIGQGIQEIRQRSSITSTYQQEANTLLSTDFKNIILGAAFIGVSYLAWQTEYFEATNETRFQGEKRVSTYIKDENMGIYDKHTTFPSSLTIPFATAGLYHFLQLSPVKTFVARPLKNIASSSYQMLGQARNNVARKWYGVFGAANEGHDKKE